MEFQFGEVYFRLITDLRHKLVSIKIIHPITTDKMMVTDIMVSQYQGLWSTDISTLDYLKGDKDAEKSAFEGRT